MTKTFLKRLLIYFMVLIVGEAIIYYTNFLWLKPLAKMTGLAPQGVADWGYGFGLAFLLLGIEALYFFVIIFIFLYETFFKLKREYDSAVAQPATERTVWPIELLYWAGVTITLSLLIQAIPYKDNKLLELMGGSIAGIFVVLGSFWFWKKVKPTLGRTIIWMFLSAIIVIVVSTIS